MFVIEKYVQDRRTETEAWYEARDKWVASGEYRYHSEYEENHPRPGTREKKILRNVFTAFCISFFVFAMIQFFMHIDAQKKKQLESKPKPAPAKVVKGSNGKKCGDYYIGDTGTINYGDYEGAKVKIVGGCGNGEDYQVITTEDQTLFAEGSAHPDYDDLHVKGGLTFSVNDSDNITITGHDKE